MTRVDNVQRRIRVDAARKLIYEKNSQVKNAAAGSEIGGWRSLLLHLLRILDSTDEQLLAELDRR